MDKLSWHTEKRKVKDLKLYPGNPRQMTEEQAENLLTSLKKFNLVEIPAIDQDNRIIAGNMRITALKKLNRQDEEIEVRSPSRDLTEEEAREYLLRSNKNTGSWDFDLLADFSEDLLLNVGFESGELDNIFDLEYTDDFDGEKALKEAREKSTHNVKTGDLWQLGEHRLKVGNAGDRECWQDLLKDDRFDFMFTDPPYMIKYNQTQFKVKTKGGFGKKQNRRYLGVERAGGVLEFDAWLSIAGEFQNPKGANVMIFENWKNTVKLWQAMEKYWKIRNMVIWHLPNRCQGFSARNFFSKYDIAILADKDKTTNNEGYEQELDTYLKEKGQKLIDSYEVMLWATQGKEYAFDRKKKTKWASITDHITHSAATGKESTTNVIFGTKPLPVLVPYIKVLSPREGIVMEPYGGSGSTLMASEIMKRKCRCIEIEPLYAEIIITRWEKFTGNKAGKL